MAKEKATEDEKEVETEDVLAEEDEPIYYKPKTLSLVSAIIPWVSWIVLAVYILIIVAQIQYLLGIAATNGTTLNAMFVDPQQGAQVRNFIYSNMIQPLLTAVTYFLLLQAAALGLNALLEIDFNIREPKN